MALSLHSSAFTQCSAIPAKYTCMGEDVSPPLTWHGLPIQTKSLVLIVDDPDAPDPKAPKMTWVHWLVYNIPADTGGLPEGVTADQLPAGAEQGVNDWDKVGYGGPCPPIGRHRYFHKLYALDTVLTGLGHPSKAKLEAAMQGHIIESTELIATFVKD